LAYFTTVIKISCNPNFPLWSYCSEFKKS